MPDDRSVAESASTWGVVHMDAAELADPTEDLKVPSSKLPWAICTYYVCRPCALKLTDSKPSRVEGLQLAAQCYTQSNSMHCVGHTIARKS